MRTPHHSVRCVKNGLMAMGMRTNRTGTAPKLNMGNAANIARAAVAVVAAAEEAVAADTVAQKAVAVVTRTPLASVRAKTTIMTIQGADR
jgi:hypothetical protein